MTPTTGLGAVPIDAVKEVDFYKNPTILSRLILNQKYSSAINRLQRFPEEASIWVSSKRNPYRGRAISLTPDNKRTPLQRYSSSRHALPKLSIRGLGYSVRQLPVHVACANLLRCPADNEALRTDLEMLITKLVVTHPASCNEVDHEGKIPLHEALWHNARPGTISMMLIASPLTLHARDKYGRTPLDLNRFREGTNKVQIKTLLLRGTHFWEQARAAAVSKMEQARHKDEGQEKQKEDGDATNVPATSNQDEASVSSAGGQKVEPVTWIKLERRALHLEQLLSGMYEKNYELGELVEELTQAKMELQEDNEKLQILTPKETATVTSDNERLKHQVMALAQALKERSERPENAMKPDAGTIEFFEDRNVSLQTEVDDLTERNREYQVEVERLELLVESFRKRIGDGSISKEMSAIPEGGQSEAMDDESLATQDLDNLMETIESKSQYATERYLARKVIDLELRVAEIAATAESELAISREENARLVRENEALVAQVVAVSHMGPPPNYAETPKMKGNGSAWRRAPARTSSQASANSASSFQSDDLQDIFQQAAAMYGPSSQPLPEAPILEHADSRSVLTEKGSATSGQITVPSLTLPEILIDAKKIYGKPMPDKLNSALKKASLSAPTNDVKEFVREATDIYGSHIPREIEVALRKASVRGADEHGKFPMPHGGRRSTAGSIISEMSTPQMLAVETGVDEILEEAQRRYGNEIPTDLASAFRSASMSTMSKKISSKASMTEAETLDLDDLEVTMDELRRVYGKPIPTQLTVALRQASLSSASFSYSAMSDEDCYIVHDPSVTGEIEGGGLSSVTEVSEKSHSNSSGPTSAIGQSSISSTAIPSVEDNVDSILGEAEQRYGQEIPVGVANAFRTASVLTMSRKMSRARSTIESEPLDVEDLEATMDELQKLYGEPIPTQLTLALRQASLSSASFSYDSTIFDDNGHIIHDPSVLGEMDEQSGDVEETEHKSSAVGSHENVSVNEDVPIKRTAGNQRTFEEAGSGLSGVWNRPELPEHEYESDYDDGGGTLDDENDLDSILEEAQLLSGSALSPALIEAWKNTSVTAYEQDGDDGTINTFFSKASARSLSRQPSSSPHELQSDVRNEVMDIVADDLDAIFTAAARMYSQPSMQSEEFSVTPSDTASINGGEQPSVPPRTPSQKSAASRRTFSVSSSSSDHLDDMYSEAARSMSIQP